LVVLSPLEFDFDSLFCKIMYKIMYILCVVISFEVIAANAASHGIQRDATIVECSNRCICKASLVSCKFCKLCTFCKFSMLRFKLCSFGKKKLSQSRPSPSFGAASSFRIPISVPPLFATKLNGTCKFLIFFCCRYQDGAPSLLPGPNPTNTTGYFLSSLLFERI
jgi:hypothetical protein